MWLRRLLECIQHGVGNDTLAENAPVVADDPNAALSGNPEAYALLFSEAVRSLAAQEASVDELRTRSGVMMSAAGVVSAFLGSAALTAFSDATTNTAPTSATPRLIVGILIGSPAATPIDTRLVIVIFLGVALAITLTLLSTLLFVSLLLSRGWTFRVESRKLLAGYVERKPPATLAEIHRSLAYFFAEAHEKNGMALARLNVRFNRAARLFIAEIVVWFSVLVVILVVRLNP
jgi:hypothetical protein